MHSPDGTQVTIIFGKQAYVFDGISSNSLCSDLIAQLEVRLGSKIPAHAQLMGNGRFLRMHEPIEEVCQICALCSLWTDVQRFTPLVTSGRLDWWLHSRSCSWTVWR